MATATASGDDKSGEVVAGDDSVLESDDEIADEDDEIPEDDDANANDFVTDDYYGMHDEDDVDMATATAAGDDKSGEVVAGDDSVLESDDEIADEDDEIPEDDDANANDFVTDDYYGMHDEDDVDMLATKGADVDGAGAPDPDTIGVAPPDDATPGTFPFKLSEKLENHIENRKLAGRDGRQKRTWKALRNRRRLHP
eukprot:FR736399.1.p1 GENE.FR736399.1~~FR736399.1.p1  ORF type:complete len:212 (+),score=40.54 FR736399.1:47-637(+)